MEIARRSSEEIRFTNRQRNLAATTTNVSRNVSDSMDELSWAEGNCDRCRFSTIALSMPEAVESSHFGNADFRVGTACFC
jgi:hypothetical protein